MIPPERFILIDTDDSKGHLQRRVPPASATLKDIKTSVAYEAHLIAVEFEPGTWKILKDRAGPLARVLGKAQLDKRVAEIQASYARAGRPLDEPLRETLSWTG